MIPQRFNDANIVMQKPPGMSDEECGDVHAYRDGEHVITAWRPSPDELVKINLGEPIWLIIFGPSMPPVAVTAHFPFVDLPPEAQQHPTDQSHPTHPTDLPPQPPLTWTR